MPNGVMYVNIMTTGSAPLASFLTVEEGIAHTVQASWLPSV